MSHGRPRSPHVQAALDLYPALRDSRLDDVAALTTPDVFCQPLVRPGLSVYHGHQGMAALARHLHAAHGDYTITITSVTEQPGPRVTIRAVLDPQPGHGEPLDVTTAYTFRDGLIATVISDPDDYSSCAAFTNRWSNSRGLARR